MTTLQNDELLERADAMRESFNKKLAKKAELRQYFSNMHVAKLMASMMDYTQKNIKILDPGAGVGSLFVACVQHICNKKKPVESIHVVAYEVDRLLFDSINDVMMYAEKACRDVGIEFSGKLVKKDFVMEHTTSQNALYGDFTHIILNPPYEKINTSSKIYDMLHSVGLQTTNMYSAFIAISHNLLKSGGQMTFISPRSFCNGTYFYPFRRNFLNTMSPKKIHLFKSRTSSFANDGVLQENVIICAKKNGRNKEILVSSSGGPTDNIVKRRVKKSKVILDCDPQMFIHIVSDEIGAEISEKMRSLPCTLEDIGMGVSTGKVVDFRIKDELRFTNEIGAVPLIRPFHISDGITRFPGYSKKHHTFIMANKRSRKLLLENGSYVLVKRFTTIEQKKRVTAAVWTQKNYNSKLVGFENRVNYFHRNSSPLADNLAYGLWTFLNSSIVDIYFRQFNGSTQVNASDLKYLRYPDKLQLEVLGDSIMPEMSQDEIDKMVDDLLFSR